MLRDNGGDDLTLSADGSFTFAKPLADGSSYSVTLYSEAGTELCWVTNGTVTIADANATSVAVSCAPYQYGAGYCIVDSAAQALTGECMDLSTCAIGFSPYCSGAPSPPTVQAYCGPLLNYTSCWF